jgi:putative FmdB family regulatory protein
MPIYEYECKNCHQQFDVMQKMSDEPVKKCPECQQDTVIRLISAAGFQLKGSGWYATDFKNKGTPEKKKESSASSDSTTTESKADTSSTSEAKSTEKKAASTSSKEE